MVQAVAGLACPTDTLAQIKQCSGKAKGEVQMSPCPNPTWLYSMSLHTHEMTWTLCICMYITYTHTHACVCVCVCVCANLRTFFPQVSTLGLVWPLPLALLCRLGQLAGADPGFSSWGGLKTVVTLVHLWCMHTLEVRPHDLEGSVGACSPRKY